jgi:hypothetical protein
MVGGEKNPEVCAKKTKLVSLLNARGNMKVSIFLKTEDCEWSILYMGKYGI